MTVLKINHILFSWYYKRAPEHFRQWTFFKSVKLLIQNYEHLQLMHRNEIESSSRFAEEATKMKQRAINAEMQLISGPHTTRMLNEMFGTKFTDPDKN